MDKECFELCKEVSEKTDWKGGNLRWWVSNKQTIEGEVHTAINSICPLYTSDYLLEKLPSILPIDDFFNLTNELGRWFAGYTHIKAEADTPLKSLLKLTLALHEAGEL